MKILCVLYDVPKDGMPKNYPLSELPELKKYPDGMTPHTSGTSLSAQARYAAGTREILECFFDFFLIVHKKEKVRKYKNQLVCD